MQKETTEIKIFVTSLLKILGISLICGVAIGVSCNNVLAGCLIFISAIVCQIAAHNIIVNASNKKNQEAELLAAQVLKEASERRLPYNLNCAYCNAMNITGISFIKDNIFECVQCKQLNKVFIQFTTARITTPIISKEDNKFIDMDETQKGGETSQTTVNDPIVIS